MLIYACNPNDTNNITPTGDPRANFVGTWSCNETSHLNGSSAFSVGITLNQNNTAQVLLSNFYQIGTSQSIYGIVANNNVTVPGQTVNTLNIRGSGNINSSHNQITWNYYVNTGADIDTCSAVFSK